MSIAAWLIVTTQGQHSATESALRKVAVVARLLGLLLFYISIKSNIVAVDH
ncbi:hypothetical protein [Phytopseudomonas seleniipraecipitans]|uniref:hypothetical protein n=1 Tax=Phytopseudomonas seleniipraecipitans TaxID=640205 RepID=UPI00142890A8|nr:hypothetical protein [Pseudomonas seleniipraecipitans]